METVLAGFFDVDAFDVLTTDDFLTFAAPVAFVPAFFTTAFFATAFFTGVAFVPDVFFATFFTPAFTAPVFATLVFAAFVFDCAGFFAPVAFATAFFTGFLSADAGRRLMLRRAAMISTTSKRISSPIFITSRAERGGGLPSRRKGTYPRTSPSTT